MTADTSICSDRSREKQAGGPMSYDILHVICIVTIVISATLAGVELRRTRDLLQTQKAMWQGQEKTLKEEIEALVARRLRLEEQIHTLDSERRSAMQQLLTAFQLVATQRIQVEECQSVILDMLRADQSRTETWKKDVDTLRALLETLYTVINKRVWKELCQQQQEVCNMAVRTSFQEHGIQVTPLVADMSWDAYYPNTRPYCLTLQNPSAGVMEHRWVAVPNDIRNPSGIQFTTQDWRQLSP